MSSLPRRVMREKAMGYGPPEATEIIERSARVRRGVLSLPQAFDVEAVEERWGRYSALALGSYPSQVGAATERPRSQIERARVRKDSSPGEDDHCSRSTVRILAARARNRIKGRFQLPAPCAQTSTNDVYISAIENFSSLHRKILDHEKEKLDSRRRYFFPISNRDVLTTPRHKMCP